MTGSLNASVAQWLMEENSQLTTYVARQGTMLGRDGRIFVDRVGDDIWVGGLVATCISDSVEL